MTADVSRTGFCAELADVFLPGSKVHGTIAVGGAAMEKLAGPQHPAVEFETVRFRAQLARALAEEGDPPRLEYGADG